MLSTTMGRTLAAALISLAAIGAGHAATFVVTNTTSASTSGGCDADCSLHDAIVAANGTTVADVIEFNVSGTGVKTITLDADGLPTITRPVTIDGYTQTGAAVNTATNGSNAVLTVALTRQSPDPVNDTIINALTFTSTANGSIVRGIAFVQLGVNTVSFIGTDADNLFIDGNFFGTNAAGDADGGQAPSAAISVNAASNNVTIGGSTAAARNLFAGIEQGIVLFGTNAIVRNNTFGVEDNGTTALGLGDVAVFAVGDGHEIGGIGTNDGNVFANIDSHAVVVSSGSEDNTIRRNVFRNNSGLGINLDAAGDPGNGVTPNDPGDADSGANTLLNFPELLSAVRIGNQTEVTFRFEGALADGQHVDLFASDTADTSGFGEGQRFVGSRSFLTGHSQPVVETFSVNTSLLPVGDFASLTMTQSNATRGNTSEFSNTVMVAESLTVNSVLDTDDGNCDVAHCSLREAILASNLLLGRNRIQFAIPGPGPHVIAIGSAGLPAITDSVAILGATQNGTAANTSQARNNTAVRQIVLSAPNVSSGTNLMTLAAGSDGSDIEDLVFQDIESDGAALLSVLSDGNRVFGCSFGLDPTGLVDGGDGNLAVDLQGESNQIGESNVADRNQFGALSRALVISGQQNVIENFTIGLDANGNATVPTTASSSILITGDDNRIGDIFDSSSWIEGNGGVGVRVTSTGTGNHVTHVNFASNFGIPVDLQSGTDPASGVTLNDALDADAGANSLQNHPLITFAERQTDGSGVIQGSIATNPVNGNGYVIQIFHSATADPAGSGEGETFLDQVNAVVNASGNATFALNAVDLPAGGFITATATPMAPPKNTSEFSPARALLNAPLIVTNTNASGSGSLHQAILTANSQAGPDRIHFAIPGIGPHRIDTGANGLPTLTGPTDLDASTQTGFIANTSSSGFNGVVRVELLANAPGVGSRIIELAPTATSSRIIGFAFLRSNGSNGSVAVRNLGAPGLLFGGNLVGTDAGGNSPVEFGFATALEAEGDSGLIGGILGHRNLFVNNVEALRLRGNDTTVATNLIGFYRNGNTHAGVFGPGIFSRGENIVIGGVGTQANAIANQQFGIHVFTGSAELRQNRIIDSHLQSIEIGAVGPETNDPLDADAGPNDHQNHPTLLSASAVGGATIVQGRLHSTPNRSFRIEVFQATENLLGHADPTAFLGEASVTTNSLGDGSFNLALTPALAPGAQITTTATDLSFPVGKTSEHSPPFRATGPDFVVNSTNDTNDATCNSAHCSLREALIAANGNADASRIRFNIPGADAVFTITPQAALPPITQPLTIDGYSQPGSSPNTNPVPPNNAVIRIVLDGSVITSSVTNPPMLSIRSADVEVTGLSIVGLDDGSIGNDAIETPNNVNLATRNVRIRGNYLGLLPDGLTSDGNRTGIQLAGEAGDEDNEIGGLLPEHQNVISGNGQHGITLSAPAALVTGNLIGVGKDGTTPRGNGGNGIQASGALGALLIGNRIAHNDNGIVVTNSGRGIEADQNQIHDNGQLGIDLGGAGVTQNDNLDADTGANNLTNKPELFITAIIGQARTLTASMSARPNIQYVIRFFGEDTCGPDGIGQGSVLLATRSITTDASGQGSIVETVTLPPGITQVTALATDRTTFETSEFSGCATPLTDTVFANSFE